MKKLMGGKTQFHFTDGKVREERGLRICQDCLKYTSDKITCLSSPDKLKSYSYLSYFQH